MRARAKGLIGRRRLDVGEALVLDRTKQIHTIAMRFPIDVLFCDSQWRVLHVVRGLRPLRMTRFVFRARCVVEVPAGVLPEGLEPGARLDVR